MNNTQSFKLYRQELVGSWYDSDCDKDLVDRPTSENEFLNLFGSVPSYEIIEKPVVTKYGLIGKGKTISRRFRFENNNYILDEDGEIVLNETVWEYNTENLIDEITKDFCILPEWITKIEDTTERKGGRIWYTVHYTKKRYLVHLTYEQFIYFVGHAKGIHYFDKSDDGVINIGYQY